MAYPEDHAIYDLDLFGPAGASTSMCDSPQNLELIFLWLASSSRPTR